MDASGVWNQRYDEIDDLTRARRLPSPQLVGTPERATLDLNALSAAGVELVGRLAAIRDGRALFSGGLRNQFALADLKMERLLDTFDEWARSTRPRRRRRRARAIRADARARRRRHSRSTCASGEIRSIVWATGFRPDYSWLDVPVVDGKATCATTVAWSTHPASTRSDFLCCGGASPRSSTAPKTMPATSSRTLRAISHGEIEGWTSEIRAETPSRSASCSDSSSCSA